MKKAVYGQLGGRVDEGGENGANRSVVHNSRRYLRKRGRF